MFVKGWKILVACARDILNVTHFVTDLFGCDTFTFLLASMSVKNGIKVRSKKSCCV